MDPATLGEHPFLRGLGAGQLAGLLGCAREVRYGEGEFIFREGEAADTVYLLRHGAVALEQHVPGRGVVTVESLGAGDILGLSWLVPGARWMLDARCVEPVTAFALEAECLSRRMREDATLGVALLTPLVHALYQRLVRVRLQRLDVYKTEG